DPKAGFAGVGPGEDIEVGDEAADVAVGVVADVGGVEAVAPAGGEDGDVPAFFLPEQPGAGVFVVLAQITGDGLDVSAVFILHKLQKFRGAMGVDETGGPGVDGEAEYFAGLQGVGVFAFRRSYLPADGSGRGKADAGESDTFIITDPGDGQLDGEIAGRENGSKRRFMFIIPEWIAGDEPPVSKGQRAQTNGIKRIPIAFGVMVV